MAGEILKETNFPSPQDFPEYVVTSASRGRWGTPDSPGSLLQMITAVQKLLASDGIGPDRGMLISDGSDDAEKIPREAVLHTLEKELAEPIFFLTPELQARVVEMVIEKTKLPRGIVEKILLSGEYDGNRLRLDAVQSAVVLQNGKSIRSLGLDDDDVIPPKLIKTVKPDVLTSVGLVPEPNSFVFWTGQPLSPDDFNYQLNSLAGFFHPLGRTVSELIEQYPNLLLSGGWTDEMHRVMENLGNQPAGFHVTHVPSKLIDMSQAEGVLIQAVTNTKTKLPDPRTVRYVAQWLWNALQPPEGRIFSYIAGPLQPFAFYKAGTAGGVTNVDSANMSWRFNPETANFVRWFPSDPNISADRENGVGLVDWQYRSDNEWLPRYLVILWKKLGLRYAYFTGITTETEHLRASSGYRPKDPSEQAASSLIGHEVSAAALVRMEFDQYGRPHLNLDGIEGQVVPRDNAQRVWLEMRNLQLICSEAIVEGHKALQRVSSEEEKIALLAQIHQYDEIRDVIVRRISGRDFEDFFDRLKEETRRQLRFTDQVLRAYPAVIEAVGQLIKEGNYPVLEYRPPNERNKNYPKGGRRRGTVFSRKKRET